MEAYQIQERDGEYVLLAHGQPQLSFRTLEQAQAVVNQIGELDELRWWQIPWSRIFSPI